MSWDRFCFAESRNSGLSENRQRAGSVYYCPRSLVKNVASDNPNLVIALADMKYLIADMSACHTPVMPRPSGRISADRRGRRFRSARLVDAGRRYGKSRFSVPTGTG